MILIGYRHTKQRCEALAHHRIYRPFVALDLGQGQLVHGLQQLG